MAHARDAYEGPSGSKNLDINAIILLHFSILLHITLSIIILHPSVDADSSAGVSVGDTRSTFSIDERLGASEQKITCF